MDYIVREARTEDKKEIYELFTASIYPYVEEIWGWDEEFQKNDFADSFASIEQYKVIEVEGRFAGFIQINEEGNVLNLAEIHLLPEMQGKGIGGSIIQSVINAASDRKMEAQIGVFKRNQRAYELYQRLGFEKICETDTHYILIKKTEIQE